MTSVPVTLCGVYPVGPENYLCAVLLWEEKRRFIPVWLPPVGGAQLLGRISDWEPTRPDTHDLVFELIERCTPGIAAIELSNYHQGVFMAQLTMEDGSELDCRPTDALILATMADLPVEVDEAVLTQASVRLTPDEAAEYFDIQLDDIPDDPSNNSASGDAKADADFQKLMREMGVEESDFNLGDTDVTKDDNSES